MKKRISYYYFNPTKAGYQLLSKINQSILFSDCHFFSCYFACLSAYSVGQHSQQITDNENQLNIIKMEIENKAQSLTEKLAGKGNANNTKLTPTKS